MKAYIKAISYYLPKTILTNEDIVKQFPEWTIEKIDAKIGISKRHNASENETATDMAVEAGNKLFEEYSFDRANIDYLLFCTQSPDYFLPTSACVIQHRLGLPTNIGAFDINLGCSGFIYGISVAKGLIAGGMAKNVLLITSETYSKHLHPKDKGNRTIFGDAAAATLVSTEGFADILNFSFGTDGQGANNLIVKTGGMRQREPLNDLEFDEFDNPKSSDYLYMDGAAILNYTLDYFPPLVFDTLQKNSLELQDIDLFVFHQANKYLMTLLRKKLRIQEEKYFRYYEEVGNTVSSTIPIALIEAFKGGFVKKGYNVMSAAPGLGYSWAGVIFKF
ncbi:MAG TPA: ketoacyl-ACP synthase III [Prolixibacteraceae bacterium]|nr:ketoacyl-ACP synthase III [Prolixibacteraceae bacterium]